MDMRRLLPIAFLLAGLSIAQAQVHGTPPSVTSLAPGRWAPGPPASVTSLGPFGYGLPQDNIFTGTSFPTTVPLNATFPTTVPLNGLLHHRRRCFNCVGPFGVGNGGQIGFGYGGVGYPAYGYGASYYMYDSGQDVLQYGQPPNGQPETMMAPPEAAGPTIFDSHGSSGYPLAPPPRVQESAAAQPAALQPAPAPPEPQVKTVLIFRDGHQLEVTNYAISGGTVLNLSGPGPRRIAISDLDMNATVKANEDRGVEFSVPKA